ncbi:SMR domain-containing protein [Rhizophagus clarus]|uniref:SMR domain-containing protein n=1 Tax=Rhizophagus clarus TaxID=94130 RepID=A0A8H3LUD7_9GLOM|nr:SMR domain-containing protein [Rhizophagus clarus]
MGSLQWNLEQLFCPPIDSTLIAAIVNDNPDFDACFEILSSLAEEANSVLDAEGDIENELSSGNSSSNPINSSFGDGSITSLELSTDSRSVEDDFDYSSNYTTDYEDYEYSKGNIEFLKNTFPTFPEARLDTLLKQNDNNVEKVVDIVLNEMHLETEPQIDDFPYSHSTSTLISNSDVDNSLAVEDQFIKHRKKKRRKQQKKQDRIILQNNGNSNNSSSLNIPTTLGTLTPSSSSPSSPSTSSCWASPSSMQSRNPWSKFEYESRDALIDDGKLCQLVEIFPDHKFENIKQALINCNGDVQNAIDILSSEGDGKRHRVLVIKQASHKIEHQTTPHHNKKRDDNVQIRIIDSNRTPPSRIYDDDEIVDDEDEHDPDHCHNEAFRCYKKRDESFKKAAQSYRKGDGAASYYSDEGWKFDAEMKKWKLRAARSLVKKHSEKTRHEHILDLHGCFVTEAIIIVKEWLNDWYPNATRLKPLKIITGKGNHSPNGVAKLPNAINKFLIEDNWKITKHTGYVLVHGLKDNP